MKDIENVLKISKSYKLASRDFHPEDTVIDIKGVKICRQANATWVEKFDERVNPHGKTYYWLTGTFENHDKGEDTDEWALANGYVSIVPVQYDLTAYHAMQQLNTWDF